MYPLLRISGLRTYFYTTFGIVKAVDGVSLSVRKGETLGLAGESGSGKSVTALSIMRLVQSPGRILAGKIVLNGEDILRKTEHEMRKIRGSKIAMCFQDPTTYLNPVMKVGDQLAEAILLHRDVSKAEAWNMAIEAMEVAQIPSAITRVDDYPYQMSGGMCQRIMIAMALSCQPDLFIADEPTTALDIIVQDEILGLIKDQKDRLHSSVILITHDLSIIAELCDRVAVMYAGNIVEVGNTKSIYRNPLHPYTKGLINSILRIDKDFEQVNPIPGTIPDLTNLPSGCRFSPRCRQAKAICANSIPPLRPVLKDHFVACFD